MPDEVKVKTVILERKFRLADYEMFSVSVEVPVRADDVLDSAFYYSANRELFKALDAHLQVERDRDLALKAQAETLIEEAEKEET